MSDDIPTWVDFKGWQFTEPFRCMCCGRRINVEQFCFGRACGGCDCGHCNKMTGFHAGGKGKGFSGPRRIISVRDSHFIPRDFWLNQESGLAAHPADGDYARQQDMLKRFRDSFKGK